MQPLSRIAQPCRRHVGNSNIDRLAFHMETMHGDARRCSAEKIVAPGSSVAANNVYLRIRMTHGSRQVMKQIEKTWVELCHRTRAVVPKEVVQRINGRRDVPVTYTINHVDVFQCVRVVKP